MTVQNDQVTSAVLSLALKTEVVLSVVSFVLIHLSQRRQSADSLCKRFHQK